MASGISFKHQFTLVNAPAGSGKTTTISNSIKKLVENTEKKILCITYTNRATEQLIMKIDNDRVDISTIHSFISDILAPFFKKKEILNLYHELFKEKINGILKSTETKDTERIEKYRNQKEISSEITLDTTIVINHLKEIYYGESQFSSYLYGGLSHDDLLFFANEVFQRFIKINKILSQKYSYIFIDEFQDTKSEILELFYKASLGTTTKLILMGDEMQQIYNDRVEKFETVLENVFYKDNSLSKNWRSQDNIVTVLNNLYFNPLYKQEPVYKGDQKPKIHIVENLDNIEVHKDALKLVLYNSHMFEYIGGGDLYRAFNERYKIFDKYNTKQILTDISMDNPDELMLLLIFITDIVELYDQKKYGQLIKRATQFRHSNEEIWKVNKHSDKVRLQSRLDNLSRKIKEDLTLKELFDYLGDNKIVTASHVEEVLNNIEENSNFKEKIYSVKYMQFKNCYNECKNQSISTQHAVKGEGHDAIALEINDGNNPNVQMYLFMELWSKNLFDYKLLKKINRDIKAIKEEYSKLIGVKLSSSTISNTIFKAQFKNISKFIDDSINTIQHHPELFDYLFKEEFEAYSKNPIVSKLKKYLTQINKLEGVLLAYKLFYVGCSRAKEKLDVYISKNKIIDFKNQFIYKMESIGFIIEEHES